MSDRDRRERIRVLIVLGALSAFGPLSMDLYLPALPAISSDLNTSQSLAQITMSACMVGLALGQLIAGPVSDALGRRRPLLTGVAAYIVLSLACAAAPNVELLIAARVLQGLAGSAGLVISRAIVRDMYGGGRNSARIFSMLMLVTGTAPVVAPLVGAQLLRVSSWRGLFVVLAGVGVALLIGAMTLRESLAPKDRHVGGIRATGRAFRTLTHDRAFVYFTATVGFACAALFVYIAASPFVIEDAYGHSAQLFSFVFAVNSVGIVVAGQVGARLVTRVGVANLMVAGLILQTIAGLVLFGLVVAGRPPLFAVLVPMFFVVSAIGLVMPNATALALSHHGRIAGSASAILGAFQFLVGGIVGPLSGLGGRSALVPMGLLIALAAIGAAVAGFAARRLTPDDEAAHPHADTTVPVT